MTQKTTGPPGRPILPPEAEDEILNTLFTNMRISSTSLVRFPVAAIFSIDSLLLW